MRYLVVIGLMLSCSSLLFAQDTVPHNFEMKPQKTNCADLELDGLDVAQQILMVENGIFRYTQDFKLNRIHGFQAAWFYSCDGNMGYVIAKIDDKKFLYTSISKEVWGKFMTSGDFLHFIDNYFNNNE